MSKIKSLYIGYFPFNKSVYTERCMAHSENQAKMLLIKRIAKKQNVESGMVFDFFRNNPCDVRLEVAFKEVD